MRRVPLLLGLFALLLASSAARAELVPFASVPGTQNITGDPGYTVGDVNFTFTPDSPSESAAVDASGIFGSTAGLLAITFARETSGLAFDLELADGLTGPLPQAATVFLYQGGSAVGSPLDVPATFTAYDPPPGGSYSGHFNFSGSFFDTAYVIFAQDDPSTPTPDPIEQFAISNMTYEETPEPGTCMLLGCGLLGLYGRRRKHVRGLA